MLTIFAVPKAFRGHIDVIQRNAIESWTRLGPDLQIILFGDEYGIEEVAGEFGADHVPAVRRNKYGTPLADDIFTQAKEKADYNLLCYVNSDIILMNDFLEAARIIGDFDSPTLMVGECCEIDLKTRIEFTEGDWEKNLRAKLQAHGATRGPLAIDYFLFTRGLYESIPPFAVGRIRYDNWLIWKALKSGAKVIDATGLVHAIHQKHDYSHTPRGKHWIYHGPEAKRNQRLAGMRCTFHLYSLIDATHYLSREGIRKRSSRYTFIKQFWTRLRLYLKERYQLYTGTTTRLSRDENKKSW